ncbi:hypothetical protein [Microbacterium kyungheense]|uniref:Uncharacterized protein n=1 Tax=Microbacterium kyungheense TaxID=1263636 RepID=A0A543FJ25_9MICO|nr:hypothetical protein [Microbacterium kyungheense]TQM33869.1 hypothetical protein FB391_0155 [Microbacterium kyungheense]
MPAVLIVAFATTFAIMSVAVFVATRARVATVDVRLRWPDVAIRVIVGLSLVALAALAVAIWFAFSV